MAPILEHALKGAVLLQGFVHVVEPEQGIGDVVVLKSGVSQGVNKFSRFRTRVRCMVVFEQINQNIEHRDAIPVAVKVRKSTQVP